MFELELELIQTHMAQKPMLRAEVGMRVRCANKASAEWLRRKKGIGQIQKNIATCKTREASNQENRGFSGFLPTSG